MAFNLDKDDRAQLGNFLRTVIDMTIDGRSDRELTLGVLSHVVACAASDSIAEFNNFIRLSEHSLLAYKVE